MPSGVLGRANLSATTNTTIYTVPATKLASFSVNICNRNTNSAAVRIAVSSSGTPAATDWVVYDAIVQGNGVLERSGLVAEAGQLVVVYASAANVTAMAFGYEE